MKPKKKTNTNHHIKEPVQDRSKKTRKKIIKAGRELFTKLGFEDTTTHLIARRAGVSVGSIYAHFPNKEEIFLTILEERSKESLDVTSKSVNKILEQGLSVHEALETMIPDWYEYHISNGKLNLEINKFAAMNTRAGEIHDYWEKEEVKEVTRWLDRTRDQIEVDDLEAAMIVLCRSIHEVFQYLYKNKGEIDEKRILNSLITMFKRFIYE